MLQRTGVNKLISLLYNEFDGTLHEYRFLGLILIVFLNLFWGTSSPDETE